MSSPPGADDEVAQDSPIPAESYAVSGVDFRIVPSWVHVGEPVTFYANASTDVGSTLNFTILYDSELEDGSPNPNSPVSVNVTGATGTVVTTFTYDHEGNLTTPLVDDPFFKVTLMIFDGFTTKIETRAVYVVGTVAPEFVRTLGSIYENLTVGVEHVFSIKLIDRDDDSLNVTWNFGDGSPLVYNETAPAGTEVYVNQTHAWSPDFEPGVGSYDIIYYLNVTVRDAQGNTEATTSEILFEVGDNFGPEGSFTASANWVDPTTQVWFYANASDREGEAIIWTFIFEKEGEEYDTDVRMTNVTAPNEIVWMNISRVFSTEGNYSVTLYITDAQLPELQVDFHNQTVGTIDITSRTNKLPYVMSSILVKSSSNITATNPTATATLYTEIADWDGDVLTATWNFGDGSELATNVTSGGKQVFGIYQIHEFHTAGYFNVTLEVTDGWRNHTVTRWKMVTIYSDNAAPVIIELNIVHTNGSHSLPGSAVGFIIKLFDSERDPLEITWDFGDNSAILRINVTDYDETDNATCEVSHTYVSAGEYRAHITFTDHMFDTKPHNGSVNLTVRIRFYEIIQAEEWDVWDTVGLGMLFSLFGAIVAWAVFVNLRRRKIDERGMTWDEYTIRKKEVSLRDLKDGNRDDPGGDGT